MYTRSTSVSPSPACSFELQPFLRLHKNSITNGFYLYIFWIIECTNCISSWYYSPSSHFEDNDECSNDFTTNNLSFS
jgi:hypothetical protein